MEQGNGSFGRDPGLSPEAAYIDPVSTVVTDQLSGEYMGTVAVKAPAEPMSDYGIRRVVSVAVQGEMGRGSVQVADELVDVIREAEQAYYDAIEAEASEVATEDLNDIEAGPAVGEVEAENDPIEPSHKVDVDTEGEPDMATSEDAPLGITERVLQLSAHLGEITLPEALADDETDRDEDAADTEERARLYQANHAGRLIMLSTTELAGVVEAAGSSVDDVAHEPIEGDQGAVSLELRQATNEELQGIADESAARLLRVSATLSELMLTTDVEDGIAAEDLSLEVQNVETEVEDGGVVLQAFSSRIEQEERDIDRRLLYAA
jgi:hypothetical protein